MSYNQPNKQVDQHQHPSGLMRAVLNTGRQKGSSATPAPISSPTPNRDYKVQGIAEKMDTTSLDQNQKTGGDRSNRPTISQGDQFQQQTRYASGQVNSSQNQGGKPQEEIFRPHAESFHASSRSTSMSSSGGQVIQDSNYTALGYGGPPPPISSGHHLRSFAARENLAKGIEMQAVRASNRIFIPFYFANTFKPMSVSSMSTQMQKLFNEFKQRIENKSGVTAEIKASLINDVLLLSQAFDGLQQSLQQEMDRLQDSKESYYSQLQNGREQVRKALEARDRYGSDREAQQRIIDELRSKLSKYDDEMDQSNTKWKAIQTDLTLRIKVMDEQLNGKRALWLDSNMESSGKREAMKSLVDPFTSPTMKQTGFNDSGYLGNLENAPLSKLEGNAPLNDASLSQLDKVNNEPYVNERRALRRGPNPNGGYPDSTKNRYQPLGIPAHTKPYVSHSAGHRTEPSESKALIVHKSEQDVAAEFKAEYQSIYGIIEGWVRTYCDKPCAEIDQKLHITNNKLWEFLMNLTYPGARRDASVHCLALLADPKARYWFIMRATISYLVRDVITVQTWKGFNTAADTTIDDSTFALSERGLAVDNRQYHVDAIHRAIQSIVSHEDYNKFRAVNLTKHSKALRDLLGPLLNAGSDRPKAGRDLGVLVVKAWDFSAKIFTSHLTFSIIFPELTSKFVAGTMIAKDQPNTNPVQLQINQCRLRLVITPVVTLRDDRGTTIRAKNLHNSFVLTMG